MVWYGKQEIIVQTHKTMGSHWLEQPVQNISVNEQLDFVVVGDVQAHYYYDITMVS